MPRVPLCLYWDFGGHDTEGGSLRDRFSFTKKPYLKTVGTSQNWCQGWTSMQRYQAWWPTWGGMSSIYQGQPQDNHSPGLTTTQSEFINCQCIVLTIWLGEVEDVVAQHWQCNHGPHLPSNTWLLAVHNEQTSQASHHASFNNNTVDGLDDVETPVPTTLSSSTNATPPPSHPMHVATPGATGTMPDGSSDPSQLQFYTPSICDIIEWAKQISHCNVASINSFPLHVDFNRKAVEYMNEAIAEHRSQGVPIPKGRWQLLTRTETDILYTMGTQDGGPNICLRSQSW